MVIGASQRGSLKETGLHYLTLPSCLAGKEIKHVAIPTLRLSSSHLGLQNSGVFQENS